MTGRAPGPHGRHCTSPDCPGGCLVTVTLDLRGLESFLERIGSVERDYRKNTMFGLFTTQGEASTYRDLLDAVKDGKEKRRRLNG